MAQREVTLHDVTVGMWCNKASSTTYVGQFVSR